MVYLWHERIFCERVVPCPFLAIIHTKLGKMLLHLHKQITRLVDLWLEGALLLLVMDSAYLVYVFLLSALKVFLSV